MTRWFVIACVIGFPFWIAFAWFYEFTPQGFKRESEVTVDAPQRHTNARKLDFAIIGVMAVAIVLLASGHFVKRGTPASDAAAIPAKSIAVLPFENLSTDKGNAYFADGMQDFILTKLADIGGLKVISRTSTMQYGSHPENLNQIGRQLGVASILEGSVQKQGDQVLINLQLIDEVVAKFHATFGDVDAVIAALPYLLQAPGGPTVANLRLDPAWDPLRQDPGFAALLKQYANYKPALTYSAPTASMGGAR